MRSRINWWRSALLSVAASSAALAQPSATYLGTWSPPQQFQQPLNIAANQVHWFRVVLPPINATAQTWFDIHTIAGPAPALSNADTELAVYNYLGNFVATDDDDGVGNYSALSFGFNGGAGRTSDGGVTPDGRDGSLSNGVYWVALGAYDTTFATGSWGATSGSTAQGNTTLKLSLGSTGLSSQPTGQGSTGAAGRLLVTVSPGAVPLSTGMSVAANLSPFGLSSNQPFFDNGTHGDEFPNDGVFTFQIPPPCPSSTPIAFTVRDAQGRSTNATFVAMFYGQPCTFFDLGTLPIPSTLPNLCSNLAPQSVSWYRLSVPAIGLSQSLDIWTTPGPAPVLSNNDTLIALYSASGGLVAFDDDDSDGFYSELTFGSTTPRPGIGTGSPFDGRDGTLAAGTYWLALSAYTTTYAATNWTVQPTGTASGNACVNIHLDGPPPSPILTRSAAVAILLNSANGVPISDTDTQAWCPLVDYGFGPSFAGCVPTNTHVDPYRINVGRYANLGVIASHPSYFFFINDLPTSQYEHATRFVLMDATMSSPTVSNGGIIVSSQGWWPVVTLPSSSPIEYFHLLIDQASDFPASAENDKGLIKGVPVQPIDLQDVAPVQGQPQVNNTWALIAIGDDREDFANDAKIFENLAKEKLGVDPTHITKVNGGAAVTKDQLCTAIMALATMQPACDKYYIFLTSHGVQATATAEGKFVLKDQNITKTELCDKLKMVAKNGRPICLVINGCFTGGLLDAANWDFPAGSVIITAADGSHQSWGDSMKFTTDAGLRCVTSSLFPDAFDQCARAADADSNHDGMTTFPEIYRWIFMKHPCYTWTRHNTMWYPAGPSVATGDPDENPGPQIREVGGTPTATNINVRNTTGAAKTDFHILYKGDVRGGTALAWNSDANDHLGTLWAGMGGAGIMITYDATKDQTMVCYENTASPIPPNGYVHFGYFRSAGGLKPIRQWWTPTAAPPSVPDPQDRVPGAEHYGLPGPGDHEYRIVLTNRSGDDGWGQPVFVQTTLRFSPILIPLENLNGGDPLVTSLPAVQLSPPFSLQADSFMELPVPPDLLLDGYYPVLETIVGWSSSQAASRTFSIFDALVLGGTPCPICPADYNNDGGVDGSDVSSFFADWEAGAACADVNQDGGIDGADVGTFFAFWEGGGC